MIAPIRVLQGLVLAVDGSPLTLGDPFLVRVRDAVEGLRIPVPETGPADIAGLLRQGMLRCQLAAGGEAELRVPRGGGWPNESMWEGFGCTVNVAGPAHFLVSPKAWEPSWLDAGASSVVEAAIGEQSRRLNRPAASDPLVIEYTGLTQYVSPGQRAAVHAAFLMPPGSTAIVNLPTGGGKTLAFQLPALAFAPQGGLTLVVVPTIALAKDQEERFREMVDRLKAGRTSNATPLAYHAGLDQDSKSAIRAGIRDGSLSIVFASPEAVMGALRGPLFDAARQGRLKVFAIDEAHVVTQWGQQFRPEFQSIAGFKDALLAVCPPAAQFRTILLTATLTAECCETLRFLFGSGGCQVVSEVALRPEPGFLLHSVEEEPERSARIMEAIWHLPRPLILYTTRRDDAANWYARLRDAGFRRLRLVRGGDLSDAAGDEALRAWREAAVDIVVATSAFGLGMDQQEVRSVIHACLPETIDRYYQEVGRAGRDGNAAIALIVTTRQDVVTAKGLAKERLIGIDRGFERWEAMWVRNREAGELTYVVSLDDRPADITESGVRNASWNLRTLVLMARARLITFAAHPPPLLERLPDEEEAAFEKRRRKAVRRFSREVAIRISDSRHGDRLHWDRSVANTRRSLRADDEKGIRLVEELRDLRRPLNDVFRDVYTLEDPLVSPPRLAGSCPVTRQLGTVSYRCADPELITITHTVAALSEDFARALSTCTDEAGRAWISYDSSYGDSREARRWRERVLGLLRYAVAGGIAELAVPDGVLSPSDWSQLTARAPFRFLIRGAFESHDLPLASEPVPRLTLLGEGQEGAAALEDIMILNRSHHVIVAPRNIADTTNPKRSLFDVVRHLSIEDLLSRLNS